MSKISRKVILSKACSSTRSLARQWPTQARGEEVHYVVGAGTLPISEVRK
jgi:hypothetical protein